MAIKIDKRLEMPKNLFPRIWYVFKYNFRLCVSHEGGIVIQDVRDLYLRCITFLNEYYKPKDMRSLDDMPGKGTFITVDFKSFVNTEFAYMADDESYDDDLRRLKICYAVHRDVHTWHEDREGRFPIGFKMRKEDRMFAKVEKQIKKDLNTIQNSLLERGYSRKQIEAYIRS